MTHELSVSRLTTGLTRPQRFEKDCAAFQLATCFPVPGHAK